MAWLLGGQIHRTSHEFCRAAARGHGVICGHSSRRGNCYDCSENWDALVMCLLNNSYGIILAKSHLPSSLDLGQDLLSFSPPHITLGIESGTAHRDDRQQHL